MYILCGKIIPATDKSTTSSFDCLFVNPASFAMRFNSRGTGIWLVVVKQRKKCSVEGSIL